jgi:hypothetical protein
MTFPINVGRKNLTMYVPHEIDFVTTKNNIVVEPAMMWLNPLIPIK